MSHRAEVIASACQERYSPAGLRRLVLRAMMRAVERREDKRVASTEEISVVSTARFYPASGVKPRRSRRGAIAPEHEVRRHISRNQTKKNQ